MRSKPRTAPERAEGAADRLRGALPGAGHMVHMPGHIYYRIGRYFDALAVNKDAAAADEKYLKASNAPMGVYRLGYYPHNVHFVLASAQMSGDGATAIAAAEKLDQLDPRRSAEQSTGRAARSKPRSISPMPSSARPDTILALPDPGNAAAYCRRDVALRARHCAGAARAISASAADRGERDRLDRAQRRFLAARRTPAFRRRTCSSSPAEVVEARIAQAKGDSETAIDRFREAAAIQDALRYTEPPFWYYPVRQSLAAALLQAGRLDEALDEFQRALKRAPNNGWTYFGLASSTATRGDTKSARGAEAQLAKTWIGDQSLLDVGRL